MSGDSQKYKGIRLNFKLQYNGYKLKTYNLILNRTSLNHVIINQIMLLSNCKINFAEFLKFQYQELVMEQVPRGLSLEKITLSVTQ